MHAFQLSAASQRAKRQLVKAKAKAVSGLLVRSAVKNMLRTRKPAPMAPTAFSENTADLIPVGAEKVSTVRKPEKRRIRPAQSKQADSPDRSAFFERGVL